MLNKKIFKRMSVFTLSLVLIGIVVFSSGKTYAKPLTVENRIWTNELSSLNAADGLISVSGFQVSTYDDVQRKYNNQVFGIAGSNVGFASTDFGLQLADPGTNGTIVFANGTNAKYFTLEGYILKSTITGTGENGTIIDSDIPLLVNVKYATTVATTESQDTWNDIVLKASILKNTVTINEQEYLKVVYSNTEVLAGAKSFKIEVTAAAINQLILDNYTLFQYAIENVLFGYVMEGTVLDEKGILREPAKDGNEWTTGNTRPKLAEGNDDGLVYTNNITYNGHRLDENNNRIELYKRYTNNGTNGTGYHEFTNPTLESHGTLILKQHTGINFVSVDIIAQPIPANYAVNFVSVYTSTDGVTFSETPIAMDFFDNGTAVMRKAVDGAPQPGWNSYTFMSKELLPAGTNYIKVTVNQAHPDITVQKAYTPLLDMVRTYENAPYNMGITGDNAVKANVPLTIQATMNPTKYAIGNVTWSIDTENTTAVGATITNDSVDGSKGVFTATGAGTAYVTATYNGVTSETFAIEVADVIPVSDVTLSVPTTVYDRRETVIKATVTPATADIDSFEWQVLTGTATITPLINPEGLENEYFATLITNGTEAVTIQFTVNDVVKEVTITPTPVIDVTSIEISDEEIYAGLATRFTAFVNPIDATLGDVTWSIVDAGTTDATITQDGVVRATIPGDISIQAEADGIIVTKTVTIQPYHYDIALDFEPSANLEPDATTTSGFFASQGAFMHEVFEENFIWRATDTSGVTLEFYQENGFNGYVVDAYVLQQSPNMWPVTDNLSKDFIKVYYSVDGVNYHFVDSTVITLDGMWKNEAAWLQFSWVNQSPIQGNARYLKLVITTETNRPYNPLINHVQLLRTEVTETDTISISSNTPAVDGVTSIGVSTGLPLFVKGFNYTNIVWNVDSADATISDGGIFTATKAGIYKVTATIDGFTSQEFTVEAIASTVEELNVTGNNTVDNGKAIDFSVEIINQFGSKFTPDNYTWVLKQGTKGDNSADFTEITGDSLNIKQAIPLNYNGTLILEITAGEKTESITITVNKVSVLTTISIDGGNTFDEGSNVTLTLKVLDQYGVEISNLYSIYWVISAEGFTQIDGRTKDVVIDLTNSDFFGTLNIEVNVKQTALDQISVLNSTVTINDVAEPVVETPKGNPDNTLLFILGGVAILGILGGAVLWLQKRK